jgi:hypothetical protein
LRSVNNLLASRDSYVDQLQKIVTSLSLNDDLFLIVVEQLLFDFSKKGYASLKKERFRLERMGELILVSQVKDEAHCEHANRIKASALHSNSTFMQF